MDRYDFKILNLTTKYTKNNLSLFFLYVRNLPWLRFTSDEFDFIMYMLFPGLSVESFDNLKLEIASIGRANILAFKKFKKKFRKWQFVVPFSNCILRLKCPKFEKDNSDKLKRGDQDVSIFPSPIIISNYSSTDTVTNSGMFGYDLDITKLLDKEAKPFVFTYISTAASAVETKYRYSSMFCDYIRTLFGKNPYDGEISVFSIIQFISLAINYGAALLRYVFVCLCACNHCLFLICYLKGQKDFKK